MYDDFLQSAKEVALKAGNGFREARENSGFSIDVKAGVDLVTTADRNAEALIFKTLKQKYSGHEFIGEESANVLTGDENGALVLSDKPTWIV